MSYGAIYGNENMPQILKQMEAEGLPNHFAMAMSTNNENLRIDILQSYTIKDLEKQVKPGTEPKYVLSDTSKVSL